MMGVAGASTIARARNSRASAKLRDGTSEEEVQMCGEWGIQPRKR